MTLLIRNARVLTLAGPRPRRGPALDDLGVVPRADVLVEGDRITRVGPDLETPPGARVIHADARVLMPAFVDPHTHLCWAGDRLDEWELRLRGASYLDILRAGGGIMSTVRAVRRATLDHLARDLSRRLDLLLRLGTATVEVKSGYGLTTDDEIKMLRAIAAAAAAWPGTVVPTALLGHALDPDVPDFVDRVVLHTLPAVSAEFPAVAVDAFCEASAWSLPDALRLLRAARDRGHPVRVHADQFHSLGMVPAAIGLGARSVDHLEASTPDDLRRLAASDTFAVILPCSGFHLDARYARARDLADAGALLALATNANPGSAPCFSMPMAIALAVRFAALTPRQAIAAATLNAAELLGFHDRGSVIPGQRADLVLLRHRDERLLAAEFGDSPVEMTIVAGRPVFSAPSLTA